jgi:hypothetical protein
MNPFIPSVAMVKDPIPTFIEKLSAGEELQIHIPSITDTVLLKQIRKSSSITVDLSSKETTFKFPKLERIKHFFSNRRSPNFPNQEQKYILNKLKQIPVYTVVNNRNEVITASPREYKQFNSLRWIQNKYNETFLWEHDNGPVSISLFFMHKEDASSYLHEVSKREPKEAEISGLHVKAVSLDVFYKLNRTSKPKMQSRLIADLNEIDSILKKHSYDRLCTMHPKQKYSKNWFQGTPVYIMKLNPTLNKRNITTYNIQGNPATKVIFFSKEDATRAWHVYTSKSQTPKPQNNPVLEIYNLENLLLDSENSKLDELKNLIIIPNYLEQNTQKTTFSSELSTKTTPNKLEKYLFQARLKLRDLERFYKGLIWLFTSDTLPSEENSW